MLKPEFRAIVDRLESVFPVPPPEVDLTFRQFFGGMGGYVRERIFFALTDEGAALKFSRDTQVALLQDAPDARHLSWTRLYLIVPPAVWDDDDRLTDWIQRSIDDVMAMPRRKR
jgi:TfoX/Sxy family transcriptional regulator of competence genes